RAGGARRGNRLRAVLLGSPSAVAASGGAHVARPAAADEGSDRWLAVADRHARISAVQRGARSREERRACRSRRRLDAIARREAADDVSGANLAPLEWAPSQAVDIAPSGAGSHRPLVRDPKIILLDEP